jgi:hypothetical protein
MIWLRRVGRHATSVPEKRVPVPDKDNRNSYVIEKVDRIGNNVVNAEQRGAAALLDSLLSHYPEQRFGK